MHSIAKCIIFEYNLKQNKDYKINLKQNKMKITEKQIQQKIKLNKKYGLISTREEAIRSLKISEKLKQRLQNKF